MNTYQIGVSTTDGIQFFKVEATDYEIVDGGALQFWRRFYDEFAKPIGSEHIGAIREWLVCEKLNADGTSPFVQTAGVA